MARGDLGLLSLATDSLDNFLGADDLREIGALDFVQGNGPSLLQLSRVSNTSSIDGVKLLESGLGPDDKTTKVS